MRDPIGALEFFCDKTAVQWLEPTYGSFLFTSNMTTSSKWMKAFYSDRGYQIFYEIMNQLQNVIYIGVLFIIFIWQSIKDRNGNIFWDWF